MIPIAKENVSRHHEVSSSEFNVSLVIAAHCLKCVPAIMVQQISNVHCIYFHGNVLGLELNLTPIGEGDCQGTWHIVTDHARKPPAHSGKVKGFSVLIVNRLRRIKPNL